MISVLTLMDGNKKIHVDYEYLGMEVDRLRWKLGNGLAIILNILHLRYESQGVIS